MFVILLPAAAASAVGLGVVRTVEAVRHVVRRVRP